MENNEKFGFEECQLFDIKKVAKLLSVSQPTIRRLIKSGRVSHKRIGDRILFDKKDIVEFISSCNVKKEDL